MTEWSFLPPMVNFQRTFQHKITLFFSPIKWLLEIRVSHLSVQKLKSAKFKQKSNREFRIFHQIETDCIIRRWSQHPEN